MHQSKTIRLLSILSRQELDKFLSYTKSPYFNTNQHLVHLLEYLIPLAPGFDKSVISYQNAFIAVFKRLPQGSEEKSTIRKLASKLLRLAEGFIEQEQLAAMPFFSAYFRKRWFRENSQSDWEEEVLRQMKVLNTQNKIHDKYRSLCTYFIEYEETQTTVSKELILEKLDLSRLNTSIDAYYLHEKLETLCHIANHSLIANQKYEVPEAEQVLQLLALRLEKLSPVTQLWQKALALLQDPGVQARYMDLKNSLERHGRLLSPTDHHTIFHYLLNTARFVFPASAEYIREMMQLYKYQIQTGSILFNGHIIPDTFYNVIAVATGLQELEWAKDFFQQFNNKLDPRNHKSEGIRQFSESMLLFELGQYEQALDKLNSTVFKDIQFKLSERRLRIKIYLELNYEELLLDQLNTFRKFLSVNKSIIPHHHELGNKTFINAVSLLFKMERSGDRYHAKLEDLVANSPILPEKKWISLKSEQFRQGG